METRKNKIWESLKNDFLKHIPKGYEVKVEGLKEDDKYFHPTISITKDIILHSQCDIDSTNIYSFTLLYGSHSFPLPDDWWNCAFDKEVLKLILEVSVKLDEYNLIIDKITEVKSDLAYNAICKFKDIKIMEKLALKAFDIKEFIENKMVRDVK